MPVDNENGVEYEEIFAGKFWILLLKLIEYCILPPEILKVIPPSFPPLQLTFVIFKLTLIGRG